MYDNLDLVPRLYPDPNLYLEKGWGGGPLAVRMDLTDPIFIDVYGDFVGEYDWENCCTALSVNAFGFEQFLQIERFHSDGMPDPFPFAPEPRTSALMAIGILGIAIAAFRRQKITKHPRLVSVPEL